MFKNAPTFPTSTLKCLLENTELADLLFNNYPLTDDDDLLKSDKQLLSSETGSKAAWSTSAFLGASLWDKDQLYGASGLANEKVLPTGTSALTTTATTSSTLTETDGIFTLENIDIDEFLCENDLNLNDIDSFSDPFELVEPTGSNSPNTNSDPVLLPPPMEATPAKLPVDDSISRHQSSSAKNAHPRLSKKARKAGAAAASLTKQSVPDELKDAKYWARRRKNNLAAKRSRDARRMEENQIALRADFLEQESAKLRKQVEDLKKENQNLKKKLIQYESSMKQ